MIRKAEKPLPSPEICFDLNDISNGRKKTEIAISYLSMPYGSIIKEDGCVANLLEAILFLKRLELSM